MSCEVWNLEVKSMIWLEGKDQWRVGDFNTLILPDILVIFNRLWRIEKLPASITCYRLSHSASPRTLSSHWNIIASNLNWPVKITKWVKRVLYVVTCTNLLTVGCTVKIFHHTVILFRVMFNLRVLARHETTLPDSWLGQILSNRKCLNYWVSLNATHRLPFHSTLKHMTHSSPLTVGSCNRGFCGKQQQQTFQ